MQAFEWLEAALFSTNMAKSGGKLGYGGAGPSKVADMKALADSAAHGYTVRSHPRGDVLLQSKSSLLARN